MSALRRHLVPLSLTWLFLHMLVITGATATVFASDTARPVSDIVCTCSHGADHGACPMHRAPMDSGGCRMQGSQDDLATALLSVLGPLALPVTSAETFAGVFTPALKGYESAPALDDSAPPDAPPPRR